ncbi:MAG TPA: nucleotidyltransferase domain-containing protein [Candidatus Hydrogenedentes bacterium]|nr:nucleotidyltransferase domain-containing protein [Candidatus Hydrogenedentota bacterium]
MEQIERFGRDIGRTFHPERVILFGSHARGTQTQDSDVDVLVVMRHRELKSHRAATQIRRRVHHPFPLDLIVRTPEQLHERLALGGPFLRDITLRGKVLYESSDH